MNARDVEALFGVEILVGLAELPTALGNDPDAPPGPVRHFEHLGQQLLRGLVAFKRDDAFVAVLRLVPSRLKLNHASPNAIPQIAVQTP